MLGQKQEIDSEFYRFWLLRTSKVVQQLVLTGVRGVCYPIMVGSVPDIRHPMTSSSATVHDAFDHFLLHPSSIHFSFRGIDCRRRGDVTKQ